jgi:hypothetical protein
MILQPACGDVYLFLYVLADEQARGLGWLLEDAGLDA